MKRMYRFVFGGFVILAVMLTLLAPAEPSLVFALISGDHADAPAFVPTHRPAPVRASQRKHDDSPSPPSATQTSRPPRTRILAMGG